MKRTFKRIRQMVFVAFVTGLAGLTGCKSTQSDSQAGLMPGSTNAKPVATQKTVPLKMHTTQQVLADGSIQLTETLNGLLYAVVWLHRDGRPDRTFYYNGSTIPASQDEFTPDGHLMRRTLWFPGTTQPQRVEEYVSDKVLGRFTTYWPNGNRHIISEANVPAPNGPVNVVQEWYENGEPKSISQKVLSLNSDGRTFSYLQGRQKAWDEKGYLVTDDEFDHGVLTQDYLVKEN